MTDDEESQVTEILFFAGIRVFHSLLYRKLIQPFQGILRYDSLSHTEKDDRCGGSGSDI